MSIQSFSQRAVALFLVAFVSGCSSFTGPETLSRGDDCKWNRSACIYEGAYEPGEKDYAEQEARRLNQAQSKKLRRWGGN